MKTWPGFPWPVCTSHRWSPSADFNLSPLPLQSASIPRLDLTVLEVASRLSLPSSPAALFFTFVSRQQPFAFLSSDKDSFPLPPSISIPLFHCLFTSLHQSVQHHSFPSLVPATGNNNLSSLSLSLPSLSLSFRVHRILSVLSGTTATRKLF